MPAKTPDTVRVQIYLTDARLIASLRREAQVAGHSLSQAAGRALSRGLRRSLPADPEDRLLGLDRHVRDHARGVARDLQILQQLHVEVVRELFTVLPQAAADRDPLAIAVVERRIERLLDRVAASLIRGPDVSRVEGAAAPAAITVEPSAP